MSLTVYTREGRVKDKGGQGPPGGVVASAYVNSAQSLPASAWTTVALNAKEYDPYGHMDTNTYRFQPKIAGYYRLSGAWQTNAVTTAGNQSVAALWKNGAEIKRGTGYYASTQANQVALVAATTYFNGTTDYVEFRAYSQNAIALATGSWATYFQAELVAASVGVAPEPWHYLGAVGEPAFNAPFANLTGNYPKAAFMKDTNGFVHFKGLVAGNNAAASTAIFTLPAGYRNGEAYHYHQYVRGSGGSVGLSISTTAPANQVVCETALGSGWVDLSGIAPYLAGA